MPKPSSDPSVFHEPWMTPPVAATPPAGPSWPGEDFADPDNPYAPPKVRKPAFQPVENVWEEPAIVPDPFAEPAPIAPPTESRWWGGLRALWRSLVGFPEPEQFPHGRGSR